MIATLAATTKGGASHRARLLAAAGAVVATVASPANAGFRSACENSRAVANRSAGIFSSAFDTAAATFGGTDFRRFVTGSTGSVMMRMMICCAEAPVCGGSPVSIS